METYAELYDALCKVNRIYYDLYHNRENFIQKRIDDAFNELFKVVHETIEIEEVIKTGVIKSLGKIEKEKRND